MVAEDSDDRGGPWWASQCGPGTNSPLGASGDVETQQQGLFKKKSLFTICMYSGLNLQHMESSSQLL